MFFLITVVWSLLGTEPVGTPRVVAMFRTHEQCVIAARQAQHQADSWATSPQRFVCFEARGDA